MMQRRLIAAGLVAVTTIAVAGCSSAAPPISPADMSGELRPIVVADAPVSLSSDQEETVVWPIWGSAFVPDEVVTMTGRFEPGGDAASGVVVAGPGEPEERVAVAIVASDGAWTARETAGEDVVQEKAVAGDVASPLTVTVTREQVMVNAGDEEITTLDLAAPLGGAGEAVGFYAYLEPGATLDLVELDSSQPLPTHSDLGTPLRELADERDFGIGTALDIWPPLHDIEFESLLGEQFNAATPTEFYWATTRGEDEDFFFVPADLSVNYATVHELDLTGMFLVWDFELPEWVMEIAESGDVDELGDVYDEHISTLVSRYADQVDTWVVVNEAIWGPAELDGGDPQYADTVWNDVLGEEHIERAFRAARTADPDAELMYNETGAEELGPKSDFLYAMVKDFLERDVPIDTVGLQFHIESTDPPDMESVQQNLQRFADLGVDVRITELDVVIDGDSEDREQLQADIYSGVLDACLAVDGCTGYTTFGFSDRYSWDELGEAMPLMFTADYEPKPAYFALQDALRG
ncbi:endo-1,4-beta-xylanase [Herbiconiux sp. L3-i23]|uniref:endo-1,4-beta-xylanase n=1 Tax=Herbiconiux sp. L3-i23 TaxID=2905871 RepID=UPI00206BEDB7|nr:endo-1,4-beta-xylanase [Herbiconiux sp. L3-i23]BDI23006.1 hypothetical protein L3i23_17820 [Herbiconiux sp. L3-i23]